MESGQRTGPKLEIRVVSNEQHILRKRLTSDSDNKLQATVSTALTIPGPRWVQGPAPWHGDGARNGAAACTTYCLDNARSRAAGATAFMQHPDPCPRTTCTPSQSSPARRRATGDKA
jgi:hypothetical protein